MLSSNIFRYGQDTPLPEQIPLRAGQLTMIYENGDLRTIKFGEHELIRRIYSAVRDRSWGTVLPIFLNVQMDIYRDSFHIVYSAENKENEIHFTWKGEIIGGADGTITFCMDGQANTTFLEDRIGFCVLLPASVAGTPCSVTQVDGSVHKTTFPLDLNPDEPPQPFTDLIAMHYPVGPTQIEICFKGDAFELEDQRNWTDASFKIYCTPLRFPIPVEIQVGTRVTQTITMHATIPQTQYASRFTEHASPLSISISPTSSFPLPQLGLGISSRGNLPTPREAVLLKALGLNHLRADINLANFAYPAILRQAVAESSAAGVPLHLALHLEKEEQLQDLLRRLAGMQPNIALWLIYPAKEIYMGGTPIAAMLALAKKYLPGPFAAGTNNDFIFFQRNIPPASELAAVAFAINPQVHAFDNQSVMETLEAQVQALQTAHKLAKDKPVMVSPITLKPSFNPFASEPVVSTPTGELPSQVDPRQMSLFTAAWTVGSIRAMAVGGAQTATYFETIGWRGVMEEEGGSPLPAKFHSIPGAVFPVYHVFAALADFAGGEVLATVTSDALKTQALAVRKDGRMRVLVANPSPVEQTVLLNSLPEGAKMCILDETTIDDYESQPIIPCSGIITLRPYSVTIVQG